MGNAEYRIASTTWEKACTCWYATARTGRTVMREEQDGKGGARVTFTTYPGPVCDRCDTPWREVVPLRR